MIRYSTFEVIEYQPNSYSLFKFVVYQAKEPAEIYTLPSSSLQLTSSYFRSNGKACQEVKDGSC